MNTQRPQERTWPRRDVLAASVALLAGGVAGSVAKGVAQEANPDPSFEAIPLPWPWTTLDPMEAGRRAYQLYRQNGCGTAAFLSIVILLKEEVGHPWTSLPDMMMAHAASGFGGHGTLCGALAGASTIINMVTFGEKRDDILQNNQIVDRLFWWYAEQEFPPKRFDDLSPIPDQVQVKAKSPLCHTSVSSWVSEAGVQINSEDKYERCAKVAGEVAYTVTLALNEYFAGRWVAPSWQPSDETEHCIGCHGPATETKKARRWNQQGHMECLMCHDDHMG